MIDLHRHLEGSVRYETLREIAREAGLPIPSRSEVRVGPRDARTLKAFLKKFDPFFNLYPSRESIERVALEAAESAEREGILHLELRFSPVHFARRMNADPVEVAGWIIEAARRGAREMTVKFIVTLGRHHSPEVNGPSVDAAIEHKGDVVALDVAGPEDAPLEPFAPLIKRGSKAGLGITIHAGEAKGPESVREAIELGATRLGHGVKAARDPELLVEIRRRGIAFECCLTSNFQTGAVKRPEDHPLPALLGEGHRVTLNTDDPEICGTSLDREFAKARKLGLTIRDLDALTDHALDAAFLSSSERKSLSRRLSGVRLTAP